MTNFAEISKLETESSNQSQPQLISSQITAENFDREINIFMK